MYCHRDILSSRVEISTPLSSFMRIKEGAFLWDRGSSPYLGDSLHQPPLILALFYPFASAPLADNLFVQFIMFTSLDVFCALLLRLVAIEYLASPEADPACGLLGKHADFLSAVADDDSTHVDPEPEPGEAAGDPVLTPAEPPAYIFDALPHARRARGDVVWLPDAVAAAYLLNPLAVLCCAGQSIAAVENLSLLAALLFAMRGRANRFEAQRPLLPRSTLLSIRVGARPRDSQRPRASAAHLARQKRTRVPRAAWGRRR